MCSLGDSRNAVYCPPILLALPLRKIILKGSAGDMGGKFVRGYPRIIEALPSNHRGSRWTGYAEKEYVQRSLTYPERWKNLSCS